MFMHEAGTERYINKHINIPLEPTWNIQEFKALNHEDSRLSDNSIFHGLKCGEKNQGMISRPNNSSEFYSPNVETLGRWDIEAGIDQGLE